MSRGYNTSFLETCDGTLQFSLQWKLQSRETACAPFHRQDITTEERLGVLIQIQEAEFVFSTLEDRQPAWIRNADDRRKRAQSSSEYVRPR